MGRPPTSGISERIIIPIRGGVEHWKEPLKEFLLVLKDQPGMIRHRWGPWSEDPSKLELLVGWTSSTARDVFVASDAHAAALKAMAPVMTGLPEVYELTLQPYAPKEAIDSAVMQMVTIRGAEDQGDERLRSIFMQVTTMDGCNGAACGFSAGPGGADGRAWVGVSGWTSLQKSQEAEKAVYIPRVRPGHGDASRQL
ncbi:hypothetical protein RB594_006516 [Gaeumannomyces avenae]